jgi:hypothetical protein
MNQTYTKLKRVFLTVCLTVFSSIFASAQTAAVSSEPQPAASDTVIASQPETPSEAEAKRFYDLTEQAPYALAAGETDRAKSYAETLLKEAERFPKNWNYGNAIHVAHLVLGHIALDAGDLKEAKKQLLEAGKTPGSAQINTFGPNMLLAKSLLEKKENEAVLQYFDLVDKFWKSPNNKTKEWKAAVLNNEMPVFGANLIYKMEALYQRQKSTQN